MEGKLIRKQTSRNKSFDMEILCAKKPEFIELKVIKIV